MCRPNFKQQRRRRVMAFRTEKHGFAKDAHDKVGKIIFIKYLLRQRKKQTLSHQFVILHCNGESREQIDLFDRYNFDFLYHQREEKNYQKNKYLYI